MRKAIAISLQDQPRIDGKIVGAGDCCERSFQVERFETKLMTTVWLASRYSVNWFV
jgi:hypothetical protein